MNRDHKIRLLFYVLILTTFLSPYFTPLTILGPEGVLRFDQMIMILLIGAILLTYYEELWISINGVSTVLFLIAGVIGISFSFGIARFGYDFRLGDLVDILIWFMYGTFIAILSTKLGRRELIIGFRLLIGLGAFISVIGILQALDFGGLVTVFNDIYVPVNRLEGLRRATGTTINPNIFAQVLIIPYFCSLTFLYRSIESDIENRSTISYGFALTVISLGMIFSYSRTGFGATVIGSICILLLILLEKLGRSDVRKLLVALNVLGAAVILTSFITIDSLSRYTSLLNPAQDNSLQTRLEKWGQSLSSIGESVIVGHGPSRSDLPVEHIDSGVLEWWFHYGIIGVVLFLVLLVVVFRYCFTIARDRGIYTNRPYFWSLAVGTGAWTVSIPFVWIFLPVGSYRRPFTIYLICVVLLLSVYQWDNS